jgi:DNA-binding MarR family transcriptional regulator
MAAPTKKTASGSKFDSPQQEAYLHLWRTYDRLREIEDETFASKGITAQQYNALRILREESPNRIPTLELADRLVSRAPDITRLLDRLEHLLLIDRVRPAENRRTVMVGITPVGHQLLLELQSSVDRCHAKQLGHLSAASIKQLVTLLREARKPHERPKAEA